MAPKIAYWRKQLAGTTRILELATDRPRPPLQSYRGKKYNFAVSASLLEELRALNALSPMDVYPVPGNHFTMMREPHVEVLARKLKLCLDAAFTPAGATVR